MEKIRYPVHQSLDCLLEHAAIARGEELLVRHVAFGQLRPHHRADDLEHLEVVGDPPRQHLLVKVADVEDVDTAQVAHAFDREVVHLDEPLGPVGRLESLAHW
ncbi:MAG: hypothetical protein EBR82_74390 [Caulobacteraceae bacterium]|nr:hypothetical protein [Caulobacteraceae bacterium]